MLVFCEGKKEEIQGIPFSFSVPSLFRQEAGLLFRFIRLIVS